MKLAQVIIACITLDAVWSKHDKPEQIKRGIFDSDFGLGYNTLNGAYGGHYGVYGGGYKGGYNDKINALIQLAKNFDATKIAQQKISPTLPNQFPYPIPYNYQTLSNTYPINLLQLYGVHKQFTYRPFHYAVPQLSPYTIPLSKPYPFDVSPYLNPVRQPLMFPSLTPFAVIPPNRGGFYNSFTIPHTASFNTNPFNPFFDNPGTVYPDNPPALPTHISPAFGNLPVPQPSPIVPQNVGTSGSAVSAAVGSSSSSVGASTQSVSSAVTSSSSQTSSGGSTSGRAVASSAAQSTTVAGSSQSVASSSSSSQSKAST